MAANAILAISSTDRYTSYLQGNANQPISNVLEGEYNAQGPYSNDFSITAPNALINGYINTIKVSQVQLQYNVPTIIPDRNDLLPVYYESSVGAGTYYFQLVTIPYGFYTPDALAAILESILAADIPSLIPWNVGYFGETGLDQGFNVSTASGKRFYFPTPFDMRNSGQPLSELQVANALKTYKLFGFTQSDSDPDLSQISWSSPQFLYTPYIDILSDALTNYQKLKDTDSSVTRRKGLVARLYLSGVGSPQITNRTEIDVTTGITVMTSTALGSYPFVLTYDLNTPKIVNWTPDTAVNSLDFQLRDCYGDLLFTNVPPLVQGNPIEQWNTEFQMTLLCVEE
jgi:hypothetical protein